jgi:hypothetical protein
MSLVLERNKYRCLYGKLMEKSKKSKKTIFSYLATVWHLKLDMFLTHMVYEPVLQVEALIADPEVRKFSSIKVLLSGNTFMRLRLRGRKKI